MSSIDTWSTSRTLAPIAVLVGLVALAWTTYGAHTWAEIIVVGAMIALTSAIVFAVVLPRAMRRPSAGGTALALSIPGLVLLLPAFWSGLPLVLGVGGMVLGNHGRSAPNGAGKSIAALVLGALTVLGYFAIYIADGIVSGNAGFLFD